MLLSMVLGCFLLLLPLAAKGTAWIVEADGTGDVPTIEAAVTAAADGDTISLGDGSFTGNGNRDVQMIQRTLTILSQSGNPYTCEIFPEGTESNYHRAFYLENTGLRIEGITIAGGLHDDGAAIFCDNSGLTMTNCILGANFAWDEGGGIYLSESDGTITDCKFLQNEAEYGGGACSSDSQPTFINCEFWRNQGTDSGGGLCSRYYSTVHLEECTFDENEAVVYGGAVYCFDQSSLYATSSLFEYNTAVDGGGVRGFAGDYEFTECEFLNNTATSLGGGIIVNPPMTINVSDCTFHENTAEWGGGLLISEATIYSSIENTVFSWNNAVLGGGLVQSNNSAAPVIGCTFIHNSSETRGGGIHLNDHSNATISFCTFYQNTATDGACIALVDGSVPFILTSILSFGLTGEAVHCYLQDDNPSLHCCDVYGNEGGDFVGCISGFNNEMGNFSEDPLFCDAPNGDLTLSVDSPCLPGNHPNGSDCGQIGAYDQGCDPASIDFPDNTRKEHLLSAYPNPFSTSTRLTWRLRPEETGILSIFDITGRRVELFEINGRAGRITWEGTDSRGAPVAPGTYLLLLESGTIKISERIIFVR